jgi:predicted nuclease of predicted toxin-antitoxin system
MRKWVVDESVDFRIVTRLRELGYEVEAITETHPGIPDEEVLKRANEMQAILITEDKDFGELSYRLKKANHGIELIRMSGLGIEDKILKIAGVLENFDEELAGKFTVISKDKIRIKEQN